VRVALHHARSVPAGGRAPRRTPRGPMDASPLDRTRCGAVPLPRWAS
jgi:hypothetical protein